MSKPLVYLAGPITGCTFKDCTDWRENVKIDLDDVGITGLSPVRAKDYLACNLFEAKIKDSYDIENDLHPLAAVLSSAKGVVTRDRWDCTRCDLVLVNFMGAESVSIGTVMEIAWADSKRIPIVMAMDQDNPHDHAMIKECVGYRTYSLEDAVEVVKSILLP